MDCKNARTKSYLDGEEDTMGGDGIKQYSQNCMASSPLCVRLLTLWQMMLALGALATFSFYVSHLGTILVANYNY